MTNQLLSAATVSRAKKWENRSALGGATNATRGLTHSSDVTGKQALMNSTDDARPIKAIETKYAGCRFRSRLEARYAVLFDHLGIKWEYEPQGFKVGKGGSQRYYLPDFFLPGSRLWVEVKGSEDALDWDLLTAAVTPGSGLPRDPDGTPSDDPTKLVILGPLPDVRLGFCSHWVLEFHEGHYCQHMAILLGGRGVQVDLGGKCRKLARDSGGKWDPFLPFTSSLVHTFAKPSEIRRAYTAARSARFEHGEAG